MRFSELFYTAGRNAPREGTLKEKKEKQAGQNSEQSRSAGGGDIHIMLPLQGGNGNRDSLVAVFNQQNERQEKFIPGPDEKENK